MKFKKMYICIMAALLLIFAATACADMGTGEAVKNSPETAIEEARKEFDTIEEASGEYGLCGGRCFRVRTTKGKTYILHTSMNGDISGIEDEKTGVYVWNVSEDDDGDVYVDVWAENVRILTDMGLSEKSAEEVETLLNRAQPDEIVVKVETNSDGSLTVYTESGYIYDIAKQVSDGYDSIFER